MATRGTTEIGYATYTGGGTLVGEILRQRAVGDLETPEVASRRGYLRNGLPAIYKESDFGMRFVGALEEVLDPVVALLDALPAHFTPDLAPRDVLELLTAWLGIDVDESYSGEERRELVRRAGDLSRRRGTPDGLRLSLQLAFPGVPLRVEDKGGIRVSTELGGLEPSGPPSFVVYCDEPLPPEKQAAVARMIERVKPVGVSFRLRVKAPKKG